MFRFPLDQYRKVVAHGDRLKVHRHSPQSGHWPAPRRKDVPGMYQVLPVNDPIESIVSIGVRIESPEILTEILEVRQLPMAEQNEPFKRGMVVVAHPDDAEWMCAGTVAKWCAEGWDVVYVLCTDGSKGSSDPEMSSEKLIEIREAEQREACRVLGVKEVVFSRIPRRPPGTDYGATEGAGPGDTAAPSRRGHRRESRPKSHERLLHQPPGPPGSGRGDDGGGLPDGQGPVDLSRPAGRGT